MSMMSRGLKALGFVVAVGMFGSGCGTSAEKPAAGLEMIISADGLTAPADFDDIKLEITELLPAGATKLWDRDYVVPSKEATLPTTFTLLAGQASEEVLIAVTAFSGKTAVVQRVAQVQVPTDRMAVLYLVLASVCEGQVEVTGAEGEPMSTCGTGMSCQPLTGMCGTNVVDPAKLPTFVPGQSLDAGGDAALVGVGLDAGSDATVAPDTGTDGTVEETGVEDGGSDDASDDAMASGGFDGAIVACPDGGCPTSAPTGFYCPFGHCNGPSTECIAASGCFCANDSQCKSAKCVLVAGENDLSCASGSCTGTGSRDGFDCALASPGIPAPSGGVITYACPAGSGYKGTTLSCDPTHTDCYCTADAQCPSGHCIPSSAHATCTSCTGSNAPDYRSCQSTTAIATCPIPILGCPSNTECSSAICYCTADVACASGHCIPSPHNGNCSSCTGTGTDDGHGCVPAPSSVACGSAGGSVCTTTLTPAPVLNAAKTACLCVADSDCSSGKCVNTSGQCTGTCTGTGSMDAEGCVTATSVANVWSCSAGNCSNVGAPSGTCTSAGVPCWCTSDSQCSEGALCSAWAGCAAGACTGTGTGNAFNCVP